jgi:hypothetical protein
VPKTVNSQTTDAATQTSVQILGSAPGSAMGVLLQVSDQALGLAAHNATVTGHNATIVAQATTIQGCSMLYGLDTAAESAGICEILSSTKRG